MSMDRVKTTLAMEPTFMSYSSCSFVHHTVYSKLYFSLTMRKALYVLFGALTEAAKVSREFD
jgi:hypothetical protein